MPTQFVCKIGRDGPPTRDFVNLSLWSITCNTDLTAATTKVFSATRHAGTHFNVFNSRLVYLYRSGVLQDCTAWLVATTPAQALIDNIRGTVTPQAGDIFRESIDPIYGYITLNNAGDSAIVVAKCYNDDDVEVWDIIGTLDWVTSSTNYLKIYTPISERHTGKAGTGYRIYSTGVEILLDLHNVDIIIDGIEFRGGGSQIAGFYNLDNKAISISNCIFHDNYWGYLVQPPTKDTLTVKIWNCVFYNGYQGAIGGIPYGNPIYVENCSIFNPGMGYGVSKADCFNVVVHRGEDSFGCFGSGCTGNNNCDALEVGTDGTAPGGLSLHNQRLEDISWYAIDENPLTFGLDIDLHIWDDSILLGRGVTRVHGSIGFDTDIEGHLREGYYWTIGAFTLGGSSSYSSSSSESYSSLSESSSSSSVSSSSSSSSFSSSSSAPGPMEWLLLRDYVY